MSFNYTAGLNNVGSFQVSGRPWLENHSFTGVESKLYEFPNVTDYIEIKNDTASGNTGNLDILFCEPRRGMQLGNAGTNPVTYYQTSGFSLSNFSISIWFKYYNEEITKFFQLETAGGNDFRYQIHSVSGAGTTRFFVNGVAAQASGIPFTENQYHNIIATFTDGNSNVYVDGQLIKNSSESFSDPVVALVLGSDAGNGFDGVYDQVLLFNKTLSEVEVANVYSSNTLIKDITAAGSIVARYEFEDNHYKQFFAIADTTTTIQDRVGSFNLTRAATSGTEAFVDSPNLTNALSHHKITLEGQQEIRLNCKTKQVFLKSTGDTNVNIIAGLTNIPSERMYELGGSGIDE